MRCAATALVRSGSRAFTCRCVARRMVSTSPCFVRPASRSAADRAARYGRDGFSRAGLRVCVGAAGRRHSRTAGRAGHARGGRGLATQTWRPSQRQSVRESKAQALGVFEPRSGRLRRISRSRAPSRVDPALGYARSTRLRRFHSCRCAALRVCSASAPSVISRLSSSTSHRPSSCAMSDSRLSTRICLPSRAV